MHQIKYLKGGSNFIKHYLDKNNKRDLLLQVISGEPNCAIINDIFIWNFNNLDCILYLEKVYENGLINSSSILNENNHFYLITSNGQGKKFSFPLKVYDLNGNKIKEIINIKKNIFQMNIYYDKNLQKNFIIIIDWNLSSYDYTNKKLYKKYQYKKDIYKGHIYGNTVIINEEKKPVKIVICDYKGFINIFNFHTGDLLFEIRTGYYAFCVWNDNYILVGETYDRFSVINISSPKDKKFFTEHKGMVGKIMKLVYPEYGECLITIDDYKIKLWTIKNESPKILTKYKWT